MKRKRKTELEALLVDSQALELLNTGSRQLTHTLLKPPTTLPHDGDDTPLKKQRSGNLAASLVEEPECVPPPKVIDFNEVLCFGSGDMSQLGLGPTTLERKNPAPIKSLAGYNIQSIASGALHNAIVLDVVRYGLGDVTTTAH